ncbi:MAG: prepilin-type N-terminal cleavage/methylation domain-containing protein [Candidatus Paceibacterota bacterium]|jgi:prepilin-type N-terminal cleavage/methylation domain-containing protein
MKTKGFTVVEVAIVMVIIGLLAAMAIPAFKKVRDRNLQEEYVRQHPAAAKKVYVVSIETGKAVMEFSLRGEISMEETRAVWTDADGIRQEHIFDKNTVLHVSSSAPPARK